jgi:hypothetical protein
MFAWDLRIDQMLFSEPAGALFTPHPGRMSLLTSAGFILMGGAPLRLHYCTQRHVLVQSLALLGLGLALFAVGCYLFGILLFALSAERTTAHRKETQRIESSSAAV